MPVLCHLALVDPGGEPAGSSITVWLAQDCEVLFDSRLLPPPDVRIFYTLLEATSLRRLTDQQDASLAVHARVN